ncbi:MAG: hypothetical protein Q7T91_03240 [Sulfuricurvum sp.]|nr:hypothetical protein [Sulfuricurvum sp.]
MKPFIYLVIFAIVFIMLKAFYFDSAHEEITPEMNVTVENTQVQAPAVEAEKNTSADTAPKSVWQDNEKLPINQLGDSIAEKLKGKM